MLVKDAITRINDDITEVVSSYVELKRNGNKYSACCPFHNERTPSFTVTPARGMFKCFGCGKGGDAISFIMAHEGVDFKEAVTIGAKKLNFTFDWHDEKNFNQEEYKHLESLRIVCQQAADFFAEQLYKNQGALDYVASRGFETGADDSFVLGYAPAGNHLMAWAQSKGINPTLLKEAGLVKTNDGGQDYDFFRNRVMFPVCNKGGKVIGFSGRSLDKETKAKYLNSPDTPIFTKGDELFGLNIARSTIKNEDRAYLVEGNFDVKRMHQIGVTNTVAPCGTALTENQATLLKQYTNKVTLIYDGDDAGRAAIVKNAEIMIKLQFHISVIELPDGEDPDTFFQTRERFEEFNDRQEDYIIYKVRLNEKKAKNPVYKSELIKDIAGLIANYDEGSKHEVYIESVSEIIKPKKAWQDALKMFVADKAPVERGRAIPKNVSLDEYNERGFYTENNCYYFADRSGKPEQRSNFTMVPLFHIESTVNAKRLYEVKNQHGVVRVVEIPQKDLVAMAAFKTRIESLGNFLWTGSESDLNRLKSWLYEKTETCKEIAQMGWQKEGFYAWGNGIFNGSFTEADKYGIARYNGANYYIPSHSKIYETEENLFEFERKFVHTEGNVTMKEYIGKFTRVFGDNGKIALCYLMASLMRDIVIRRFDKFPILNLFGPKGAGKNACAESLLYFFGRRQKIPNLHNTSKPALADHVATSANALCVLDEYRNDLEMEKREFLKGLWDGTGRTRMNMDKDKKKETTSVDQGVIVCGQQMATADIALFSRFVVLSFTQTEYTDEEKKNFENLEETNKRGLTHLTHQILKKRASFQENYFGEVEKLSNLVREILDGQVVETRVLNNWLSVMGAYATLNEELELPWDYNQTIRLAVSRMLTQNGETKKNDDIGNFWKSVQFLISSNLLFEGGDFKVDYKDSAHSYKMEGGKWVKYKVNWPQPKNVFYLATSRVFSLYKSQALREGDKPLPESTVEYYLKNSRSFLFENKKESFKKIDPKSGIQEEKEGVKKYTSTTALAFDLDILQISISVNEDGETMPSATVAELPQAVAPNRDGQSDLPF